MTTAAKPDKAKVFMNGRSQAVRIPQAYRFDVDEVEIRRDAVTGDVVLSQARAVKTPRSWAQVFAAFDAAGIPDDFMADRELQPSKEREGL